MSDHGALAIASRFGEYSVIPVATFAQALTIGCREGKSWIIIDEAVYALHQQTVLSTVPTERIIALAATEEAKSFERLTPVFLKLLATGFKRDCTLLAIGGGVIQDIAAFIAAILVRGVRWEFIPTTLLAQCDSCIGAKSSINIGQFKNQLGSFYPPRVIHLVEPMLDSLPEVAIRSGLGEIVKFHLLDGVEAWKAVQATLPRPTPLQMRGLIWRSLGIKRRYIEIDELDTGIRNLLNYGHTFGHAFESVSGFSIPHGIGVALGMAAATFISEQMSMASKGHFAEVNAVLSDIYHPFENHLKDLDVQGLIRAMRTDKKNVHGKCFVILTRGPGQMEKVSVDLEGHIGIELKKFINLIAL